MYNEADGFVIDAPSLEVLDIDYTGGFCVIENDMPKIKEANIGVTCSHPGKILGSITSVQRLRLCLSTSENAYPVGSVFDRLEYLQICTCCTEWLNLLMRLLRDSANLQTLRLKQYHPHRGEQQPCPCWNEPSSVPECLLTSLETLEWVNYEGTEEEKEVVAFILSTGSRLKNVTINPKSTSSRKKLRMIKELSVLPRRSPTCRLVFD